MSKTKTTRCLHRLDLAALGEAACGMGPCMAWCSPAQVTWGRAQLPPCSREEGE